MKSRYFTQCSVTCGTRETRFRLISNNLKPINLINPELARPLSLLRKLQKVHKWNLNCFRGNSVILSCVATLTFSGEWSKVKQIKIGKLQLQR